MGFEGVDTQLFIRNGQIHNVWSYDKQLTSCQKSSEI